jgi:hypothetical protein
MLLILIDLSPFFNLTPFLALEQLPEPLRELPEVLDFRKSAEKMDNLEKAFSLLFWYREQEGMDSQAQGAQAWQLFPVLQEELAWVVSGLERLR